MNYIQLMYELIECVPNRFKKELEYEVFCDKFDDKMWNNKIVRKAFDYYLIEIWEELNNKEKQFLRGL